MSAHTQSLVQKLVVWALVLSFPAICYLAIIGEGSVTWPIIIGYALLVALLQDKLEEVAVVVDSWRGHGNSGRGGNDD